MSQNLSFLRERVDVKTRRISAGLILVGLGLWLLLVVIGHKIGIPAAHGPWWYVVAVRIVEALLGVGALSLVFEIFIRRHFVSEMVEQLKLLFAIDKAFAGRLTINNKKQLVLNTLKAHLNDDRLAEAIYTNLIDSYFSTGNTLTRYNLDAIISLRDLDADIELACGDKHMKLAQEHFYRIELELEYKAAFSPSQSLVGVILTEEPGELQAWFTKEECFFRHYFLLPSDLRNQLISIVGQGHCSVELLNEFFGLAIEIGKSGIPVPIQSLNLKDTRGSIEVLLNGDALLEAQRHLSADENIDEEGVLHRIKLRTCIPKEAKLYPYLIRNPHKNPYFRFQYSRATLVDHVIPLVNFSGDAANAVKITHNDEDGVAEVNARGNNVWVFPNSSVVFRWN